MRLQGSKLSYDMLTAAQQQMLEGMPASQRPDQTLASPLRSLSSMNGLPTAEAGMRAPQLTDSPAWLPSHRNGPPQEVSLRNDSWLPSAWNFSRSIMQLWSYYRQTSCQARSWYCMTCASCNAAQCFQTMHEIMETLSLSRSLIYY